MKSGHAVTKCNNLFNKQDTYSASFSEGVFRVLVYRGTGGVVALSAAEMFREYILQQYDHPLWYCPTNKVSHIED